MGEPFLFCGELKGFERDLMLLVGVDTAFLIEGGAGDFARNVCGLLIGFPDFKESFTFLGESFGIGKLSLEALSDRGILSRLDLPMLEDLARPLGAGVVDLLGDNVDGDEDVVNKFFGRSRSSFFFTAGSKFFKILHVF